MMPKNTPPIIQCCLAGDFHYRELDDDELEPPIEEDYLNSRLVIKLDKNVDPNDLTLLVTQISDELEVDVEEKEIAAVNGDSIALREGKPKGCYMHFDIKELACSTDYQYQVIYKGKILPIPGKSDDRVIFKTFPARQDPQPLRIALGGDQERHEQFNPFAACFGLDNLTDTAKLYQHMGAEEQPYQLFIHLGDLFNGEVYFSPLNLFRSGRHVFERRVKTLEAFRHHLDSDFIMPVGNNLAHLFVNAVYDDHDTGGNNAGPPTSDKERRRQQYMVNSFHELLSMENFLDETIAKKGPYYSKRVGQTEFFYLHNRYTKEVDSDDSYLLGSEQWEWLERSLENSKAQNKVLVSPLPFVMGKNPQEDYRGHWQEWHRMMQLCRQHKVSTILTADSHNYSHSEIHVREKEGDDPWIIHQHLVGTLGGSKQSISDEERQSLSKPGLPPLLPEHSDFNPSLYEGSTVKAYFSPGDKTALLPQPKSDSQWCPKEDWSKKTHAYAGLTFFPPQPGNPMEEVEIHEENKDNQWQAKFRLFTCSKKKPTVSHDPRLDIEYTL